AVLLCSLCRPARCLYPVRRATPSLLSTFIPRPPPRSTLFPTRRSSDLKSLLLEEPNKELLEPLFAELEFRTLGKRVFGEGFNVRSEEHTSELQSRENLVCRLLLEKKKRDLKIPRRHYSHENTSY